jgi:hypothetical protein
MFGTMAKVAITVVSVILVGGEVYFYNNTGKLHPCEAAEVILEKDRWEPESRRELISTGAVPCFVVALLVNTPLGPDDPRSLFRREKRVPDSR